MHILAMNSQDQSLDLIDEKLLKLTHLNLKKKKKHVSGVAI